MDDKERLQEAKRHFLLLKNQMIERVTSVLLILIIKPAIIIWKKTCLIGIILSAMQREKKYEK